MLLDRHEVFEPTQARQHKNPDRSCRPAKKHLAATKTEADTRNVPKRENRRRGDANDQAATPKDRAAADEPHAGTEPGSGDQDRGAVQASASQIGKRFIGANKGL